MARAHTCKNGSWVDINIARTDAGGRYRDACENDIKVEKGGSLSGLSDHILLAESIRNINHNGTKQNGFPLEETNEYKKTATVYYLKYDESNALPLVVGLEKTSWNNKYDYYKREYPLSTYSPWIGEGHFTVNKETQLPPKLTTITSQLKQFVVLNLGQTIGTYYANGNPSQAPAINGTLKIEVTESEKIHDCYKKFTHSLETKDSFRVLSTKISRNNIPFNPPVYGSNYNEASVYYWTGDTYYSQPLLIQLGEEGKY